MHYKNGREAKNGDKVVLIQEYKREVVDRFGVKTWETLGAPVVGILYDATPGNDYCNGKLAPTSPTDPCPNLKECLHLDDVIAAVNGDPLCEAKSADPVPAPAATAPG
jgi:hypothetical protein